MWQLDPQVVQKYPGFCVGYGHVSGVTVEQGVEGLEEKKQQVLSKLRSKYAGSDISGLPEIKCYRELLKKMGIETRPRLEELLQEVLRGNFPSTNNVLESCLLVSIQHMVIVSAHDLEKVVGIATTTLAERAEEIQLVDGRTVSTASGEIILRDQNKVLATLALGSSRAAAVTPKTSNVLVVVWNAPGVGKERVEAAVGDALLYLRKYCGGHVEGSEVL
jgi:DNA/RNA-binding domain of Phe-tRNA-synthetase-like protein